MPLVAYSLGAYVGGLLAGFQGSLIVACAVASVAVAVGALRGRVIATTLGVLALAGVVVAHEMAKGDVACAKDAAHRSALTIRRP